MAASVYVSGDRNAVMCAVDSATVIAKGDLVYLDTDDVKPFSSLTDSGTKAQNQAAARDVFMGVALRSSADGESLPIPVATAGVFEFDTAAATYEVGDLVGAGGTGTAGAVGVSASVVAAVASGSLAVGKVYKRGTTVTRVQVAVQSTKMASAADDLIAADTISEVTAAAGVTVDGVLLKDAGIVATGTLKVGGTDVATVKGIYHSGTIAVTVPSIANDAAENVDSVAVSIAALTFAAAVGDAVIANPLAALPTDCLLLGAYVSATDEVTVTFGSKEGGAGVTGAAVNFSFLIFDLT